MAVLTRIENRSMYYLLTEVSGLRLMLWFWCVRLWCE